MQCMTDKDAVACRACQGGKLCMFMTEKAKNSRMPAGEKYRWANWKLQAVKQGSRCRDNQAHTGSAGGWGATINSGMVVVLHAVPSNIRVQLRQCPMHMLYILRYKLLARAPIVVVLFREFKISIRIRTRCRIEYTLNMSIF